MRNFIVGALTVIVVGLIAYIAYQYGRENSTNKLPGQTVSPTAAAAVVTEPSPTSTTTSTPTLSIEEENNLVKQALLKKYPAWNENEITIKIKTNDGKYASGSATSSGGGGYFFAAKVNGVWKIVADGNGTISCSSLKDYPDFPATLIPECFDETTGKSIKR